jgi:hypothetical protein
VARSSFCWSGALAALLVLTGCGSSDSGGSPGTGGAAGASGAAGAAGGGGTGASSGASGAAGADGSTARLCNGHAELCDRAFNEVVFAGSHNSMSNKDDGWLAPDQIHNIGQQLDDGIRLFLIDSYNYNGDLYLCHSICGAGSILLVDALGIYKKFMDEHPDEVLAFIIEDYITPAETEQAFNDSGLVKYVYVHPDGQPWPTLGEMIDSGQRLLVTAQNGHPPPDWYQSTYDSLVWDTPYSFKTTADFTCDLNRGKTDNPLFLVNHWLENPLPDPNLSTQANTYDVLYGRAKQCMDQSGKLPNFIAVNHYSIGDLFKVVDTLNGF